MPATLAGLAREIAEIKELLTELVARAPRGNGGSSAAPKSGHSSIDEFCAEFGFSRSHYLNLRRSGEGPRETMVGAHRPIITAEDKAAWLARRQAMAADQEVERQRQREARAAGEAPPFRASSDFHKPRRKHSASDSAKDRA
jgi:hypothetical protein